MHKEEKEWVSETRESDSSIYRRCTDFTSAVGTRPAIVPPKRPRRLTQRGYGCDRTPTDPLAMDRCGGYANGEYIERQLASAQLAQLWRRSHTQSRRGYHASRPHPNHACIRGVCILGDASTPVTGPLKRPPTSLAHPAACSPVCTMSRNPVKPNI